MLILRLYSASEICAQRFVLKRQISHCAFLCHCIIEIDKSWGISKGKLPNLFLILSLKCARKEFNLRIVFESQMMKERELKHVNCGKTRVGFFLAILYS